jgi:hypothetical protein
MASAGTSAPAPAPAVTVTQTKGYDWALGVRKALHTFGAATLVSLGTVVAICLNDETVRVAILAAIPDSWGSIARVVAPVLLASAVRYFANWQKHRNDVPTEVTAVQIPEAPK